MEGTDNAFVQGDDTLSSLPLIDGPTAANALDVFEAALNERWSYRHANGADFPSATASLRKRIAAGIPGDELGIELQKIIALGIDGHSGVIGYQLPTNGYLSFLIEATDNRFVAINADRKNYLANGFPFITKIDGKSLADWIHEASVLVSKGSPQYVRQRSLRLLSNIDYWRGVMKLPRKDTIDVELTNNQGKARKMITLPVVKSALSYGLWPSGGSRLLNNNVGYLRLTTMRAATSVAEIKQWMPKFRDTDGLIVDVRDNNGGDRDALLLLYSYLAAKDDPPRVFNVAAYRLNSAHKANHLAENHHMYLAGAIEWTDAQRAAVAQFAKTFKPLWKLPPGQFSDWHYMALTRLKDSDVYHYNRPVIVLLNGKSFSATDIFLAGMKGMKNVLLLGTPSSGGSAFTQEIALGSTPLKLRIGSIVSFQADGKLFDGNGVLPDVLVESRPEYYIGGRDNVLEEAVKRIKKR